MEEPIDVYTKMEEEDTFIKEEKEQFVEDIKTREGDVLTHKDSISLVSYGQIWGQGCKS